MGTWAIDAFGNDTAADWAWELENAKDLSLVESVLDRALSSEEYLDSSDAMEALAAIEVVARLQGNWGERSAYSEPVDQWVEANRFTPGAGLVSKAHRALEVIAGPRSELSELWGGSAQHEEWLASLGELKSRVRA